MRQRIENVLQIKVIGQDLTKVGKIEFYIRQGDLLLIYTPIIEDAETMHVEIPKTDADRLRDSGAKMQFAFTDLDGNDYASDVLYTSVGELINAAGYSGGSIIGGGHIGG